MTTPPATPATPLTPQKRRAVASNDFYTLLKSPDVRMSEDPLKKRSKELNNVINRSPNPEAIRELSQTLKTRLNYANIKVQHGWSSIDEAEDALLSPKPSQIPQFTTPNGSNTLNGIANLDITPLAPPQFSPRQLSNYGSPYNARRGSTASMRLDDIANRGVSNSSPDRISNCLLLSSPQKQNTVKLPNSKVSKHSRSSSASNLKTSHLQTHHSLNQLAQPLNENRRNLSIIATNKDHPSLEQDAILSLMSMSSPVKYTHSHSNSHSSISDSSPSPVLSKPVIFVSNETSATNERESRSPYHSRGPSVTSIKSSSIPLATYTASPPSFNKSSNLKNQDTNNNSNNNNSNNNNDSNSSAILEDEDTEEEIMEYDEDTLRPGFGIVSLSPSSQQYNHKISDSTDEEQDEDTTIDESFDSTQINDTNFASKISDQEVISHSSRDRFRETKFDKAKMKMTTKKDM